MPAKNEIEAASQTLHQHWRAGTKVGTLDDAIRPRDRAENGGGFRRAREGISGV